MANTTMQQKPYWFEFLEPRVDWPKAHIRTCYHFRTNADYLSDALPAVAGQFLIFMCGKGDLHFGSGTIAQSDRAFFIAPTQNSAQYHLNGPLHAVGIGLTELGWAELVGRDLPDCFEATIKAADIFGPEVEDWAEQLSQEYLTEHISPAAIAHQMASFIAQKLKPVDSQTRKLILTTRQWALSEQSNDVHWLYDQFDLSTRQIQRLVKRHFGLAPVQYVKNIRASIAAAILAYQQNTAAADETLAQYYDQSHLIRDVRKVTGRSPTQIGNPRESVLTDILEPDGYIPHAKSSEKAVSDSEADESG